MDHVVRVVRSLCNVFEELIANYNDEWSDMERVYAAWIFYQAVQARYTVSLMKEEGFVALPDGVPGFTPPDDIPELPLFDDEEIEIDEEDEDDE